MEEGRRKALLDMAGPDIRFDRPMRLYTTFRVGGPASVLLRPRTLAVLKRVHGYLLDQRIPWLVVGKGSNLLVSDRGFDGAVIRLRGELAGIEAGPGGSTLHAGAGATIRRLLDACAARGLGGLEFLAGIPGTAGGAVAMNAGAWGRETADAVESVTLLMRTGDLETRSPEQLGFAYRSCTLPPGALVTGVRFRVQPSAPDTVRRDIERNLECRRERQPSQALSAGSVFRNPAGDTAGRLVEAAGLKGRRIGGAEISPRHANVIVNRGRATARDVFSLMRLTRGEVLRRSGVALEPEIRFIGFFPEA